MSDCLHDETCQCFERGLRAGIEKAHNELRHWDGAHDEGCQCDLCITLVAIVEAALASGRLTFKLGSNAAL